MKERREKEVREERAKTMRANKTSSDFVRFNAFRHTFRSDAALWVCLTARARDPCSERASERARPSGEPSLRFEFVFSIAGGGGGGRRRKSIVSTA